MFEILVIIADSVPSGTDGISSYETSLGLFTSLESFCHNVLAPGAPQAGRLAAQVRPGTIVAGFLAREFSATDTIGDVDELRLDPAGKPIGYRWRHRWDNEPFPGVAPNECRFQPGDLVFDLSSAGRPALVEGLPPDPETARKYNFMTADARYYCHYDYAGERDHSHPVECDLVPANGRVDGATAALLRAHMEQARSEREQ